MPCAANLAASTAVRPDRWPVGPARGSQAISRPGRCLGGAGDGARAQPRSAAGRPPFVAAVAHVADPVREACETSQAAIDQPSAGPRHRARVSVRVAARAYLQRAERVGRAPGWRPSGGPAAWPPGVPAPDRARIVPGEPAGQAGGRLLRTGCRRSRRRCAARPGPPCTPAAAGSRAPGPGPGRTWWSRRPDPPAGGSCPSPPTAAAGTPRPSPGRRSAGSAASIPAARRRRRW